MMTQQKRKRDKEKLKNCTHKNGNNKKKNLDAFFDIQIHKRR